MVAAKLLPTPDAWITCADAYLAQLDRLVTPSAATGRQPGRHGVLAGSGRYDPAESGRSQRGDNLAAWHDLLLERLPDYDAAYRLDRIAEHPALASTRSAIVMFRARVALLAGNDERARELITAGLENLPGHTGFYHFAAEIGAAIPERAKKVMNARRPAG